MLRNGSPEPPRPPTQNKTPEDVQRFIISTSVGYNYKNMKTFDMRYMISWHDICGFML